MTKETRASVLLSTLLLASVLAGCRTASPVLDQVAPTPGSAGVDESPPARAGLILLYRDGDLHILDGQSERRITHSGDYATGALTPGGDVIALRRADDGGSSLLRLEMGEGTVEMTAEVSLSWQPHDQIQRPGYLSLSPDAEYVLIGLLLITLDSGRQMKLLPPGCCASWSPDGRLIAYLAQADDQEEPPEAERASDLISSLTAEDDHEGDPWLEPPYDLWVAHVEGDAIPRRIATGLMQWEGIFGRDDEDFAWRRDSAELLALSADGVTVIERSRIGGRFRGPVNNRLILVDVTTGEVRHLASAMYLHQMMEREGSEQLEDEVVVSAPAASEAHERAAFMVMDYGSNYAVGILDADGRLEELIVQDAPDGHMVWMEAPVWSPDGTRLAYFGWDGRSKMPFIDVLHISTDRIDRVWESTVYRKPGHWDLSPDGGWVWIIVSTYHADDPRSAEDRSMLASVERPGHVEEIQGHILDWCCVDR